MTLEQFEQRAYDIKRLGESTNILKVLTVINNVFMWNRENSNAVHIVHGEYNSSQRNTPKQKGLAYGSRSQQSETN